MEGKVSKGTSTSVAEASAKNELILRRGGYGRGGPALLNWKNKNNLTRTIMHMAKYNRKFGRILEDKTLNLSGENQKTSASSSALRSPLYTREKYAQVRSLKLIESRSFSR